METVCGGTESIPRRLCKRASCNLCLAKISGAIVGQLPSSWKFSIVSALEDIPEKSSYNVVALMAVKYGSALTIPESAMCTAGSVLVVYLSTALHLTKIAATKSDPTRFPKKTKRSEVLRLNAVIIVTGGSYQLTSCMEDSTKEAAASTKPWGIPKNVARSASASIS
jgi:hypothetical protein